MTSARTSPSSSCPRACRSPSTATSAPTRSFSGGTYHSAVNGFARGRQTLAAARERKAGRAAPRRPQDPLGARRGSAATRSSAAGPCRCRRSTAPIVRRSAAAVDRYGPDFTYGHNVVARHLATVGGMAAGVGAVAVLAPIPPTRKLLLKAKSPGDGPDEATRARQLVQDPLRRRGRREARRHRGLRRRPGLLGDVEDARRVRPLPRLRRPPRARRPTDYRCIDG